jgi:S-adenosylmethionine:tRNA ribosyltransferase-isomerase
MKTSDFDYHLPEELIAQNPAEPRDHSRLMVLRRADERIAHHRFYELPEILDPGKSLLVINTTRVLAAKLVGSIPAIGPGKVEALLLGEREPGLFQAMVKPGAKFQPGRQAEFMGDLRAEVIEILEDGTRLLRFDKEGQELERAIDEHGLAPIPPYIRESTAGKSQYQTVYARERGSVAAPTAGLHFTPELLETLRGAGVGFAEVILHVGRGTFLGVKTEDPREHKMHSEEIILDETNARILNEARAAGRKIIAVGTTSVRVLESCFDPVAQRFEPRSSETDIFIYPGYQWRAVDAMITNFHLPRSTLLMLISSFAGRDFTLKAYNEAIREHYRFYSFGDAMLIL